ncbi:hypothetical protein [Streptomyces sp. NPDC058812]|uniref:hypothetical protein n=1 Tax=unclassified Streptomyces TaxID=2593676 RepID=UPI0036742B55
MTDVLDLAETRRVREYGTAGLTRVWDPFGDGRRPLELPLCKGRIGPAQWRRGL